MSHVTGGDNTGSVMDTQAPDREQLLGKAIGRRPILSVKFGGVEVECLLDTGSQVTTVTETFFERHMKSLCKDIVQPGSWLTLTAANGLQIPYCGYVELDVEIAGRFIPKMGVLIIKDPADAYSQKQKETVPGLLGMNVIGRCADLLMGDLNVLSPEQFQSCEAFRSQHEEASTFLGCAKVAGRKNARIPAESIALVRVSGCARLQKTLMS